MPGTTRIPTRAFALAGLLASLGGSPATADTVARRVVVSQATASWTDANDNDYATVSASVEIIVGVEGRPLILVTKEAFRADLITPITDQRVVPGETIAYRVTVTNEGDTDATAVHLDDQLPAPVSVGATLADGNGWSFTTSGNAVEADLEGTLPPSMSRYFWITVQVR